MSEVTSVQIAEWRALQDEGMVSAVGEYTPDEFWIVLDELAVRDARIAELEARPEWVTIQIQKNTIEDIRAELAALREQVPVESQGWSTEKPSATGAYYVRGFRLFEPDSPPALVEVADDNGELVCNLHESNSTEAIRSWSPVAEFNDEFEWLGPLYAAQVAEASIGSLVEGLRLDAEALGLSVEVVPVAKPLAGITTRVLAEMVAMIDSGDEHGAGSDWHTRAKAALLEDQDHLPDATKMVAPIPDDGEGVEFVAYLNTATGEVAVYGPTMMDWDDEGEPVESLMTVADHNRIVSALQASAMVVPDIARFEKHAMKARECLSECDVVLLSSIRRLLAASPAPGDSK